MLRRCTMAIAALGLTLLSAAAAAWDQWDQYAGRFLQADGRIIDLTFDQKSTSEGQGYALFFALVANDRPRFDALLNWTDMNLANGQLGNQLAGWHWGQRDDGSWGIKDPNSAPDADLWMAYALLEAGRLWKSPVYTRLGSRLLDLVAMRSVADSPVGKQLLALNAESVGGETRLPIDPSYIPPFQFRYFAQADAKGPWQNLLESYLKLSPKIFEQGIAPDLLRVRGNGKLEPYPDRPTASYDAIRVYLWAAMSGADGKQQLAYLEHFAELIRENGVPPEKIDVTSGKAMPGDFSPVGFIAASIPYLQAIGENSLAAKMRERLQVDRARMQASRKSNYYDESLVLFALGYLDGSYRFDAQGRLQPRWAQP